MNNPIEQLQTELALLRKALANETARLDHLGQVHADKLSMPGCVVLDVVLIGDTLREGIDNSIKDGTAA
jgi:uncharacterized protein YlaN (UPF0358 family)